MTEVAEDNIAQESPVSPGKVLKDARLKAGLSCQDVADKLFLKVSVVEELEADRIDSAKSITFSKGYVKNYAKMLGLDVEYVIGVFEAYHNKPDETAKLQSFSKRVAKQAQDDRWMMVTYALLVLLIGAVVLWWYQQPKTTVGNTIAETGTESNSINNPLSEESPSTAQPNVSEEDDSLTSEVEVPVVVEDETMPSSNQSLIEDPIETGTGIDAQSSIQESSEQALEIPPADQASLVFVFAEDCWVNVTDATGEAIAYGVKAAGREMRLQGQPPFQITLGAPQVVQITYNGEPVDMSEFTGREIGRLTLPRQE
ncbi:DUF4115 domain-containing protein [Alteromonas sediminis]|uniref:DUF4115 domain-containing protein n=1 Tax=Alteromonas sediminis TaxID=2259342 RepID=A0A3N5Y5U9_9ALTE|nr:RodZ domain-containing protein [Alteromonas sediminis]RPJ65659.1 DUF4115 domain-containing protein [Alteromonas sediminis]